MFVSQRTVNLILTWASYCTLESHWMPLPTHTWHCLFTDVHVETSCHHTQVVIPNNSLLTRPANILGRVKGHRHHKNEANNFPSFVCFSLPVHSHTLMKFQSSCSALISSSSTAAEPQLVSDNPLCLRPTDLSFDPMFVQNHTIV